MGDTLKNMTWSMLLFDLLSLPVIRMLPVFLALFDSNIRTEAKFLIGWFGPGGLARFKN